MYEGTVSNRLARGVLAAVEKTGADVRRFAHLPDLAPEVLENDSCRVSTPTMLALWEQLTLEGRGTSVGAVVGRSLPMGSLGVWDHLFGAGENLIETLGRVFSLIPLVGDPGAERAVIVHDGRHFTVQHTSRQEMPDVVDAIEFFALATYLTRTADSWQVDLGSVQPLWQTQISGSGLGDFWVFASATPFNTRLTPQQQQAQPGVWSSHQTASSDQVTVPTDTAGRYVMVEKSGPLSVSHVAVDSGAEISVGNTISDNYVHNVGVEYTGAVGIWGGYARKTTITHNEIGDLPYSGISFGWAGWHTNATTPFTNPNIQADNVISDNVIYNVMGERTDGAPIYTNGPQG